MSKPNPTAWLVAQGGATVPQLSLALFAGKETNEQEAKRIAAKLSECGYHYFVYWPQAECSPNSDHKLIQVTIPQPVVQVKDAT